MSLWTINMFVYEIKSHTNFWNIFVNQKLPSTCNQKLRNIVKLIISIQNAMNPTTISPTDESVEKKKLSHL